MSVPLPTENRSAEPRPGRASPRSGLAEDCLRGAIHDLRGSLNTIAILHEVARSSLPSAATAVRDALAAADRAVRGLDRMLGNLRDAAASLTCERRDLDVGAFAADAAARAGARVRWSAPTTPATVAGGEAHLRDLLDRWLGCAAVGLSEGATIDATLEADGDLLRLTAVAPEGDVAWPPTTQAARRLSAEPDADPAWFALHCAVTGLGGELTVHTGTSSRSVTLTLPLAQRRIGRGEAAC